MTSIEIILTVLAATIIASLIIGFFLSRELSRRDESARKKEKDREEKIDKREKDREEKMINSAAVKFARIAEKAQENIRQTAEDKQKLEEKDKDYLSKIVKDLTQAVDKARTEWGTDTEQLREGLKSLTTSHTQWAEALSNPGRQGSLSEESLEMLLKTAGFEKSRHFDMQYSEKSDEGKTKRPDCYIYLPDDGVIVIDSKAPIVNYKKAFETKDQKLRKQYLEKHAKSYVQHARDLKKKDYIKAVSNTKKTPDHIFMFVGNAALYLAALESMPDLDEKVRALGVSICPPPMLYAALKMVWLIWKEKQMTENAEDAQKLMINFHKYVKYFISKHFNDLGDKIDGTVDQYDAAVKSWDRFLRSNLQAIEDNLLTSPKEKVKQPSMINKNTRRPKLIKNKAKKEDSESD